MRNKIAVGFTCLRIDISKRHLLNVEHSGKHLYNLSLSHRSVQSVTSINKAVHFQVRLFDYLVMSAIRVWFPTRRATKRCSKIVHSRKTSRWPLSYDLQVSQTRK